MPQVNAAQFIALFNTPQRDVEVTDLEVDGKVEFNQLNYRCSSATVTNCKFTQDVFFEHAELGLGCKFVSCQFQNLVFNTCLAVGYKPIFNFDGFSIRVENCQISTLSFLEGNQFERGITIANGTVIKELRILGLRVTMGNLHIEQAEIQSYFQISQAVVKGTGVRIHESVIKCRLRTENLISDGLSITASTFAKDIYLWGGALSGLTFNDGTYEDTVIIQAVDNKGTLTIIGGDYKKSVQIDFEDKPSKRLVAHGKIYLSSAKLDGGVTLNGAKLIVQEVTLVCSPDLTGTISFNSCQFKLFELKNDNHKANLNCGYCDFEILYFNHFTNYGNVTFYSGKAIAGTQSEFIVNHSNLGKTQFLDFDQDSFSTVSIIDSITSGIVFSGMTWFDDGKLTVGGDGTLVNKKKREVYRQLKQASESQSDRIQSLEFQARELNAFRREISERKKRSTGDWAILWLSQSNDFGLNWIKPMWLLVLATVVIFIPIVICASPQLQWEPSCKGDDVRATWSALTGQMHILPQMLNPTRNLKGMFPETPPLTAGVYFWDALHRIILAFLLVQIVAGFRKFVKS